MAVGASIARRINSAELCWRYETYGHLNPEKDNAVLVYHRKLKKQGGAPRILDPLIGSQDFSRLTC